MELRIRHARAPRLDGVRAVFTTREGGSSRAPFDTANLAHHTGDDPADVERNRSSLAAQLGVPVQFIDQVHSATAVVMPATGMLGPVRADALVTDRTDVALAIMVADCLPVLLSDPAAGVIGAAHAGRRGLLSGVLEATVARMEQLGARAATIDAAIGPSICGRCYEVPEQMRTDSAETLPSTWATTAWGTPALDLRAGARAILQAQGIPADRIDDDYPCTREDPRFFSYRREQRTGRFVGAIRRLTEEPRAVHSPGGSA